jgi:beta-galactosidase
MTRLNRRTKLSQLLHATVFLLVCAGFGNPSLCAASGELRQSLNGAWQFTANAEAVTLPDAKWDVITVPGNWDVLPAYATHIGKGWYQRKLTVPADWRGKHIRLKFDAVYETAEVWLNGKSLGTHRGGYTPFEFEVTKLLRAGENTVTVCADNTFRRGAWWAWGGISRDVTLIANNPMAFSTTRSSRCSARCWKWCKATATRNGF